MAARNRASSSACMSATMFAERMARMSKPGDGFHGSATIAAGSGMGSAGICKAGIDATAPANSLKNPLRRMAADALEE